MPEPPRRKRRSFGGESGVWFRRRYSGGVSSKEAANEEEPTTESKPGNMAGNVKKLLSPAVQWDDTLARPVFRRPACGNQVSSEESDDHLSPERPTNPKKAKINYSAPLRRWPGTKRTRTYGGRSRRPLSLLLTEEIVSETGGLTKPREDKELVDQQNNDASKESDFEETNNTISTVLGKSKQIQSRNTKSDRSDDGPDPFAFENDQEESRLNQRKQEPTPQRPTAHSSVEHAQKYFAHLDSSCQLQLESFTTQKTPSPHRPLGRTTRKICLTSPGFQEEYCKYSKNSRELGVSPLTPADYARSRRQFFRKDELFDGFIDS